MKVLILSPQSCLSNLKPAYDRLKAVVHSQCEVNRFPSVTFVILQDLLEACNDRNYPAGTSQILI